MYIYPCFLCQTLQKVQEKEAFSGPRKTAQMGVHGFFETYIPERHLKGSLHLKRRISNEVDRVRKKEHEGLPMFALL